MCSRHEGSRKGERASRSLDSVVCHLRSCPRGPAAGRFAVGHCSGEFRFFGPSAPDTAVTRSSLQWIAGRSRPASPSTCRRVRRNVASEPGGTASVMCCLTLVPAGLHSTLTLIATEFPFFTSTLTCQEPASFHEHSLSVTPAMVPASWQARGAEARSSAAAWLSCSISTSANPATTHTASAPHRRFMVRAAG